MDFISIIIVILGLAVLGALILFSMRFREI